MPYLGVTPAAEFTSKDLNGEQLILDADADTTITADTDDQIDIRIAGADDFQFTANTFTAQSGSTIAAQALTATTIATSSTIDLNGNELILDANADTSITADTDNTIDFKIGGADAYEFKTSSFTLASVAEFIQTDGNMYLSDTSNANMTRGLTLNQATIDTEILALKSSDVAHGITSQLETDTYCNMYKVSATSGGVNFVGATEASIGVRVRGFVTTEDTTKGSTGQSACEIYGVVKSGTSLTTMTANTNALGVVGTAGHTQFIVDTDGDVHYDGTTNAGAWDDYDDVELLDTFRSLTITDKDAAKNIFGDFIDAHAKVLNDTGVITLNEDGHHFVSTKGLNGLLIDSIRQTNARMKTIVNAVEEMMPGFSQKLNERLESQSLPALPA